MKQKQRRVSWGRQDLQDLQDSFVFLTTGYSLSCIVLSQRAEAMVGRGKMVRNEAFEDIRKQEIISGRSLFI